MKLIKEPKALELTAQGRSTFRIRIKEGLMVPGVRLGENSVAWPEHEIIAINAARVAGKSDEEIRQLVTRLIADRKTADAGVTA